MYSYSQYYFFFLAECAPTLAPWRATSEVTSQPMPQKPSDITHIIYDINDIVHFEDNDLVMRDSKENNKMDNNVQYKYNDVKAQFKNRHFKDDAKSEKLVNDLDNDLKAEELKNDDCECQHGGGCVSRVCLCPLGYAGDRCEITLDLKVSDVK